VSQAVPSSKPIQYSYQYIISAASHCFLIYVNSNHFHFISILIFNKILVNAYTYVPSSAAICHFMYLFCVVFHLPWSKVTCPQCHKNGVCITFHMRMPLTFWNHKLTRSTQHTCIKTASVKEINWLFITQYNISVKWHQVCCVDV
jgi:hypothetical protein